MADIFQQEQERFTRFIQSENERLNRLIRNLYLHFHLEHYRDRDLYDHICQELADYFHADTCSLYLVSYEEDVVEDATLAPRLQKWIELMGACGPWRRALRQHYVRRRSRSRYQLPITLNSDQLIPELTRRAFFSNAPWRYNSAYDFRKPSRYAPSQSNISASDLSEDLPRQVIWFNDGLYNSARCALVSPIVRESNSARRSNAPFFLHIGVIKIENRSSNSLPGFSESSTQESAQNALLFGDIWEIAALRPYVRDLQRAVRTNRDPFLPLHNNVGWQQYFDDHPQGSKYYHQLLRELRRRRKVGGNVSRTARTLGSSYTKLAEWLESLLEVLIRIEAWLQHLKFACRVACRLTAPPSLDRPAPSLFDIYNLAAAHGEQLEAEPSDTARARWIERSAFPVVRRALLECLSPRGSKGVLHARALEALSSVVGTSVRLSTQVHRAASISTTEDQTRNRKDLARLERELAKFQTFLAKKARSLDHIESTGRNAPRLGRNPRTF